MLNILGCLDRPTSGSYRFAGEETAHLTEEHLSQLRRHQIGFVFQSFHLVPRLTAAGNVELPMIFAGIPPEERQQRVRRALELVALSARADHRPDQLSGGEQQRWPSPGGGDASGASTGRRANGKSRPNSGREIVHLIEG